MVSNTRSRGVGWKLTSALALAALSLVAAAGWLLGGAASPANAAGMLIADGGLGGTLEVAQHEVRVTINNGIAVTEVNQVFRNKENRQVEALYLFPVPKGASVANFSMWINGKEMVGEVLEKKKAREIYESYKQVRRDPGLLEQVDYKNFELRIFPIGPGAEQKVQITYYQELEYDHDQLRYVYPLATSPKPGIDTKAQGKFGINVQLKSEVPIVEVQSPSHGKDFAVVKHADNYREASLETKGGDLNRDVVLTCRVSRPHTGIDLVAMKQPGEDGYLMLTLTAGEELKQAERGMDYVFVLDVSGSMNSDGKLGLSQDLVQAFVSELGPQDRLELIAFNVSPETLFKELRKATPENRQAATAFLKSREGRGGTALRPAMSTAYKYAATDRPLNVVILSDGLTEQSERTELLSLIRSRPANSRVFSIGVGNDVNRPLLSQLAEETGGLAAFLSRGDDFAGQAKSFRRKLMRPAADNVQITVEGVETYDMEPKQLPSLYHGMPLRLLGRYKGQGAAKVRVQATVNGAKLDQAVDVKLPATEPANPEIARMWAWHRIDRLLKEADRAGSRTPVIEEIVRLGEGYSIVTEYTSFLVLENDGEYQRWKIDRRNLLRVERDRQQQAVVQEQLKALRERAMADMGPKNDAIPNLEGQPDATQTTSLPANNGAPTSAPANTAPSPARRDLNFAPSNSGNRGGGGGAVEWLFLAGLGGLAGGKALANRRRAKAE